MAASAARRSAVMILRKYSKRHQALAETALGLRNGVSAGAAGLGQRFTMDNV